MYVDKHMMLSFITSVKNYKIHIIVFKLSLSVEFLRVAILIIKFNFNTKYNIIIYHCITQKTPVICKLCLIIINIYIHF